MNRSQSGLPATEPFTFPAGAYLIERPRLLDQLDSQASVVVLRAPTGFGKSTVIAQWAYGRAKRDSVVPLRIDPTCGDATTFWLGLVDALVDRGLTLPPMAYSRAPRALAQRLLTMSQRALTLVIDQFENVTAAGIAEALLEIVTVTPGLRLVVATRTSQHFDDRLLLAHDVELISAHQLMFTTKEIAALIARVGVAADGSWAETVRRAGGGWPEPTEQFLNRLAREAELPADLRAAAVSFATDFFHERLLPTLKPGPLLDLVLATSIPETFTAELATALTGEPDAAGQLDRLEGAGLLIAEVRDGVVHYRWPPVARSVLTQELVRRDPSWAGRLRSRLAHWYLDAAQPGQALREAVAAEDWPLVIAVIDASWQRLLHSHHEELFEAFTRTPLEVIETSPRAIAVRDIRLNVPDDRLLRVAAMPGFVGNFRGPTAEHRERARARAVIDTGAAVVGALRRRGAFSLAEHYTSRVAEIAERARRVYPADVGQKYPSLQLSLGLIRMLADDLVGALQPLSLAYEFGPEDEREFIQADAAGKSSLALAVLGELNESDRWHEQYAAAPLAPTWLAHMIRITAATARVVAATDRLHDPPAADLGLALRPPARNEEFWSFIVFAQAQRALLSGSIDEMLDRLERVRIAYPNWVGNGGTAGSLLAAIEANLLLAAGRANEAHAVLGGEYAGHSRLQVPAARLALLTGETESALRLANDISWTRTASARDRLEMLLLAAVALRRLGEWQAGQDALRQAADQVAGSGALRAFLTVPLDELRELSSGIAEAEALLGRPELAGHREMFPASVSLIRLTAREQLVLDHLAEGMTIGQTARALVVSSHTVKSQIQSLYRKLEAGTRDEAIARARQLGIV